MDSYTEQLLLKYMDDFVQQVKDEFLADGQFVIGDATSAHFADMVKLGWDAMAYSAKLEADLKDENK